MNSPEQDEQIPVQVSRALATDTEAPSEQTDQNILQFAAAHASGRQAPGWKTWMPATAACCLVGVLTFSLLPEQQADSVQTMDVDMQVAKSKQASREVITQSKPELAGLALADEFLREEAEATLTAATANYSAAAAPAAIDRVLLTPEFFERLMALNEQENTARRYSGGFAQTRPDSLTPQASPKRAQGSTETNLSSLIRTREIQNDERMQTYEALRNECDCGLPDSLQQALHMLAKQQILVDDSAPHAGDHPQ